MCVCVFKQEIQGPGGEGGQDSRGWKKLETWDTGWSGMGESRDELIQ